MGTTSAGGQGLAGARNYSKPHVDRIPWYAGLALRTAGSQFTQRDAGQYCAEKGQVVGGYRIQGLTSMLQARYPMNPTTNAQPRRIS